VERCSGASTGGGGRDASCAGPLSLWSVAGVRATGAPTASGTPTCGCGPGLALVFGAPSAGAGTVRACEGVAAGRASGRRRRLATGGGYREEGRGLVPVVGSNRCTSRLMLPRGRVSVCLCAVMTCAPGSWPRGVPRVGGGGHRGAVGPGCGRGLDPSKKAHVFHRGAGIRAVPPSK